MLWEDTEMSTVWIVTYWPHHGKEEILSVWTTESAAQEECERVEKSLDDDYHVRANPFDLNTPTATIGGA
jgi:hypothetical protein